MSDVNRLIPRVFESSVDVIKRIAIFRFSVRVSTVLRAARAYLLVNTNIIQRQRAVIQLNFIPGFQCLRFFFCPVFYDSKDRSIQLFISGDNIKLDGAILDLRRCQFC